MINEKTATLLARERIQVTREPNSDGEEEAILVSRDERAYVSNTEDLDDAATAETFLDDEDEEEDFKDQALVVALGTLEIIDEKEET
jgi:hypothetical protein